MKVININDYKRKVGNKMKNDIAVKNIDSITQPFDINIDEIEKKAKDLLELHELNQVPVNLFELCDRLGIQLSNTKFKEYKNDYIIGAIKKESDGKIKIYINKEDSLNRNRFTIAHELGHYTLEHLGKSGERMTLARRDGYNTIDRIERQANQFAAALLMNKEKLESEFKELDGIPISKISKINLMSRIFGVSEQAMKFRLMNLGLI